MTIPDNPSIYVAIAAIALLSFAAAQSRIIRRVVSLALWLGSIAVLTIVFAEQGRFHPTVAMVLDRLNLDSQQIVGSEVRVPLSADGHFWVRASVGSVERRMLVDTGATVTALAPATAQAAGSALKMGVTPVITQTANGSVVARSATVSRLTIGGIEAVDLPVVVSPGLGRVDVLGMNFLMRLQSWRVEDRTLILVPKPADNREPTP
jgi:aspartyl protease family protein